MSRRRKDPLRSLTGDERQELIRLSRSPTAPPVRVARATMLLAVAGGSDYQQAARAAGRNSGDAVSHLVTRFNREGLPALDPRHGGGHTPTYDATARARILREAARTPTPQADGATTWSLTILRRVLRTAPDGLPTVSTFTIWRVLHAAGYTFQRTRTWCPTDSAVRKRKAGVATVTDPDAAAKKVDRGRLHHRRVFGAGGVVRGRGRPVPGGPAHGRTLAATGRPDPATPRVRPRRHGQGADPVPPGRRPRPGRGHDHLPERRPAPVAEAGAGRGRRRAAGAPPRRPTGPGRRGSGGRPG